MATSDLSLDEIRDYFLQNGGTVANRDVVRHFRHYLTDPASKDDARLKFKRYINVLAHSKNDGGEKILSLRPNIPSSASFEEASSPPPPGIPISPKYDPRNAIGIPTVPVSPIINSPVRAPPPYKPPPPVVTPPAMSPDNISLSSSNFSLNEPSTPQAPPRRRSTDKLRTEQSMSQVDVPSTPERERDKENDKPDNDNGEKQTVSVKERTQKFNRLASVEEGTPSPKSNQGKNKKKKDKGADEDDGATVAPLESKQCTAWYVAAAKGDYQELAKLARNEPRLVKLKDPFTTVLHWGSKHGNVEIIKLFAGTYRADVNARTNGGYTPLHMAAQFGHEEAFKILVQVYKANENLRDFSGKKPVQYKSSHTQARPKTINKIKGRKNKYGDKEMGFLRIGSLNVRVKKTTEAFSSFLGVGGGSLSSIEPISEKVHKAWGSADNLGQENSMPPPKGQPIKRKTKRPLENSGAHSNPGTPNQPQKVIQRNSLQDSDSDTAAGFDSHWQH